MRWVEFLVNDEMRESTVPRVQHHTVAVTWPTIQDNSLRLRQRVIRAVVHLPHYGNYIDLDTVGQCKGNRSREARSGVYIQYEPLIQYLG